MDEINNIETLAISIYTVKRLGIQNLNSLDGGCNNFGSISPETAYAFKSRIKFSFKKTLI